MTIVIARSVSDEEMAGRHVRRTWLQTAGGSSHLHLQRASDTALDCFASLAMTVRS